MENLDENYVRESQDRQIRLGEIEEIGTLSPNDGSGELQGREVSVKELWAVELRCTKSI